MPKWGVKRNNCTKFCLNTTKICFLKGIKKGYSFVTNAFYGIFWNLFVTSFVHFDAIM